MTATVVTLSRIFTVHKRIDSVLDSMQITEKAASINKDSTDRCFLLVRNEASLLTQLSWTN